MFGCASPVQNVKASLVTLIVKVPGKVAPPPGSTADAPAPPRALPFHLGWADKDRDGGYGYEFSDDPLAAGSCRVGPCPEAPGCPRWSDCEVSKILNFHKDEFAPCLGRAMDLGPRVRTVAFVATATVKETGAVDAVSLTDVDPPDEKVTDCVRAAFRDVKFLIDTDGATTNLTVPIRLMPEFVALGTRGPGATAARR